MFAWVLLVGAEEDGAAAATSAQGQRSGVVGVVERALLTCRLLRRQVGTRGRILCLINPNCCPSEESVKKLKANCDYTMFLHQNCSWTNACSNSEEESFILELISSGLLSTFQRVAILHPNLVILNHYSDSVFESNGVLYDTGGEWGVIVLEPNLLLQTIPIPPTPAAAHSNSHYYYKSLNELCKILGPHGSHHHHHHHHHSKPIPKLADLPTLVSSEKDVPFVKLDGDLENVLKSLEDGGGVGGGLWNEVVLQKLTSVLDANATTCAIPPTPPILLHHPTQNSNAGDQLHNAIAVIGMSCRFPGASSLDDYWSILSQGQNTASTRPPPGRQSLCAYDYSSSTSGNFLSCPVDHFDADFFGLAPSEAEFTDPQARLLLETSWEALEDAGIVPSSLRGSSTGIFHGSWLQDYKDLLNLESSSSDFLRKYMGNAFGTAAAKLSFFYGLTGPNLATESGCSSSMVAVDLACKSLLRRECPLALASGANLILLWKEKKLVVWSPDGKSKTFDAAADGYGRAEGIGVLVLKRASDAVAANDRIYGLILGSGVSQEGESASFGSPTVKSEAAAMRSCLRDAGISPGEVDFIEAHATGTAVGDPIEAAAICEVYGGGGCSSSSSSPPRTSPLYIGSGKTNIGHTESCSGIAGIIKVLLSLQHETIPAHLNVAKLNPKINFDSIPGGGAQIPFQNVPWPRNRNHNHHHPGGGGGGGRARIATVSSFGITGTDVHMVLKEAPLIHGIPGTSALLTSLEMGMGVVLPHILSLSARTLHALEELTQKYSKFLENNKSSNLMDICYTGNASRAKFQFRRVLTGLNQEQLVEHIRTRKWHDGGNVNPGATKGSSTLIPPTVCFTFPGAIGRLDMSLARTLYASFPVFRMNLDKCHHIFKDLTSRSSSRGSPGLLHILKEEEEDGVHNATTSNSVPRSVEWYATLVAIQYSLAQLWISWGVRPTAVMGHCLGEIVAGMVSSAVSLEDGFRMVSINLQGFIDSRAHHSGDMLVVRGDEACAERLIKGYFGSEVGQGVAGQEPWLEVATLNSKTQTVIAGNPSCIQSFKAFCLKAGVKCHHLPVDFPLHSRGIEDALSRCRAELPEWKNPTLEYISSVTGGLVGGEGGHYWYNCFRHKVDLISSCNTAAHLGIPVFLEIGLSSALTKLMLENFAAGDGGGGVVIPECIPSFGGGGGGQGDGGGIVDSVARLEARGVNIDWSGYYQFYPVAKVSLPHYPFQRKSYWFKKRKGGGGDGMNMSTTTSMVAASSNKYLHPLLGARVSLAGRENNHHVTFEAVLNPSSSSSNVQFLYDHRIGEEVVFPAAGYLEMMVAAGMFHHHDPSKQDPPPPPPSQIIIIRDFSISSPLLVDKEAGGGARMQTVIEVSKGGSTTKVGVWSERSQEEEDQDHQPSEWKLHASGMIETRAVAAAQEDQGLSSQEFLAGGKIDLEEIMERCSEEIVNNCTSSSAEFYLKLGSMGLNFGESFKSILSFYRDHLDLDHSEILAEVHAHHAPPPGGEEERNHILHPILIDSMIQALFIDEMDNHHSSTNNKLHVPVSLQRLTVFPWRTTMISSSTTDTTNSPRYFVHCKKKRNSPSESSMTTTTLVDSHGNILAVMENPGIVATSVEAVLEAGRRGRGGGHNNKSCSGLDTFEVVWEPAVHQIPVGPAIQQHPSPPPPPSNEEEGSSLSPGMSSILETFNQRPVSKADALLDSNISHLCSLYVLSTLYELGWEPEELAAARPGPQSQSLFLDSDLRLKLKIVEPLALAFSRFLDFLVEDGILELHPASMERGKKYYYFSKPIPTWSSVKRGILDTLDLLREVYPAVDVISAVGSQLGKILRGALSAQYVLFGTMEEELGEVEDTLAERYYSNTRFRAEQVEALREVFGEVCRDLQQGHPRDAGTLRILEVGAGTGAFTREALSHLAVQGLQFEYHFTDISSSYFERARERFKKDGVQGGAGGGTGVVVYKVLDLEKDPLEQGFPPAYFDVVIAVDVLHATSSVRKTISHLKVVMRPGATLIVGETEGPVREIDLVFGILSGYWCFQDRDLRTEHCLLGAEQWEGILRQAGFSGGVGHCLAGGAKQKSVIVGRLDGSSRWDGGGITTTIHEGACGHTWLLIGDHFPKDFVSRFSGEFKRVGRALEVVSNLSSVSEEFLNRLVLTLGGKKKKKKGVLEGIICFGGSNPHAEEWADRRELTRALFVICKYIGQGKVVLGGGLPPRLVLVTTGTWVSGHEGDFSALDPSAGGLWGLMRNLRAELLPADHHLNSKSIDLDPAAAAPGGNGGGNNMERLFVDLWLDDKEPDVLYRQGVRYVRRLKQRNNNNNKKVPERLLEFPTGSSRFCVRLPPSKAISDLKFDVVAPSNNKSGGGGVGADAVAEGNHLKGTQIEVEIKSASLNFRDVLTVMKPSVEFEQISILGLDYAGLVTQVGPAVESRLQVGDPVYGVSLVDSTIGSHIVTEATHGVKIPPGLTFSEAATLPAVFLTAWYCMVHVAQLKPGQVVLVHAVTGGVGLAALQIARILGVEVIGTAGSPRKRDFARRSLGVRHVFNSRSVDFREGVRQVTDGSGVDMVLNCLTGPGFKEASLELVKKNKDGGGGHFVEISKLDIWREDEVSERAPGVNYKVVWVPDIQPPVVQGILLKMNELLESGRLKPLLMSRFQASHLIPAMGYLQRAKHLGKVIVEMPSFQVEGNRWVQRLFERNDRTYLITGGLGAIGLAVARWMVEVHGARHLVLVGRRSAKKPSQAAMEAVAHLREEFGATIVCKSVDISSYEECRQLLLDFSSGNAEDSNNESSKLPPLGGIHHCAGVICDKLLVNQEWEEDFEPVLEPKADGLYNLHLLTRNLPATLEFFVTYSSVTSISGNVGQSNYAAGNAYMDSLMEVRNYYSNGAPGLCINWGQWRAGLGDNLEMRIASGFSVAEGIRALEGFFMENKSGAVVAGRLKFPEMVKMVPSYGSTFLSYLVKEEKEEKKKVEGRNGSSGGKGKDKQQQQQPFLVRYKKSMEGEISGEEKGRMTRDFVREAVAQILGLQAEEIEDSAQFSSMGMDSLMSIELTNKLQSELPGLTVGYIDMEEFGSVAKMSDFVDGLVNKM